MFNRLLFIVLQELLVASRNLEFFTNGYRYLIQILPAAVVAPMYFSGKIEFGVINQSVSAFNHILSDFSLVVYQFQAISAFSAVINRLGKIPIISSLKNSVPLSQKFCYEFCTCFSCNFQLHGTCVISTKIILAHQIMEHYSSVSE